MKLRQLLVKKLNYLPIPVDENIENINNYNNNLNIKIYFLH